MTLKEIADRLERIEQMPLTRFDVHGRLGENDDARAAIVRLRLDIEIALLVEGKL